MMESSMALKPLVFITGPPGVGKTTLIIKVLERVRNNYPNVQIRGFYTRETRDSAGERVGFEAVTVDGRTVSLASTSPTSSSSSSAIRGGTVATPKVGRYSVDVGGFEELVLPELTLGIAEGAGGCGSRLFVIDEVGKMELFSPSFFPAVQEILNSGSAGSVVLGTIPVPKLGKEIAEVAKIKSRSDVAVYCLTKRNRDAMVKTVFSHVDTLLKQ